MSRNLFVYTTDFSVQANFSAYAGGLHAGLLARGWLQTADTGQIVPSTVSVPSGSAYAGYCIYKTNDGVGTQFFMKLRYGRGDSVRKNQTEFTLGTGSDGAGTLTGNVGPAIAVRSFNGTDPGAVKHRALVAGDAGRLTWLTTIDDAGTPGFQGWMVIARTVDASQTQNGNGMEMFWYGSPTAGIDSLAQYFLPAPSYSTNLYGWVEPRGVFPYRQSNTAYLGSFMRGAKVFFSHPVNIHDVGSQYPNPNVLCGAFDSSNQSGLQGGAEYKVVSGGITREYHISTGEVDNGIGTPASWAPRID